MDAKWGRQFNFISRAVFPHASLVLRCNPLPPLEIVLYLAKSCGRVRSWTGDRIHKNTREHCETFRQWRMKFVIGGGVAVNTLPTTPNVDLRNGLFFPNSQEKFFFWACYPFLGPFRITEFSPFPPLPPKSEFSRPSFSLDYRYAFLNIYLEHVKCSNEIWSTALSYKRVWWVPIIPRINNANPWAKHSGSKLF